MSKLIQASYRGLFVWVLLTGWLGSPARPAPLAPSVPAAASGEGLMARFRPGLDPASSPDLARLFAQAKVRSFAPIYEQNARQSTYRLNLQPGADPADALAILHANAAVAFVEPDYQARLISSPNDPRYLAGQQWGLAKIQAETAWAQTSGSPTVVIAVIDSGIDLTHPDLSPNLWVNPGEIPGNGIDDDSNSLIDDVNGWNFVEGSNDVQDMNGHGTLVAGIAAARSNNGIGIAGVCGQCRILPVKITQLSGFANYSDIAAGINYAVAKGAKVLNLSVGGYADSQAVQAALANAASQNVLVVAGAGNDNKSDPFYPAAYESVLAVAGSTSADLKYSSSNYGAWVDLSAPGENILSTTLGDYASDTGSSYATPFVSGTAGLLFSLHPDWTAAMVKAQLTHTTDAIDSLNPALAGMLGAGRLNAGSAMQAPHPVLSYTGYSGNGTANLRPDFGSTVNLSVSLFNHWADASGVSATLSTTDPLVAVTTSTASYPTILSGTNQTNAAAFVFNIAAGAGYNHAIPFKLDVSANGGAYTTSLNFSITTRSSEEVFSGTIDADTLWTSDKTYKITGNVGIAPGATLTIQAGTVVRFAGNYALNIGGGLVAQGTAEQPIRFEAYTSGTTWSRILFDDQSTDALADGSGLYQSGNILQYVTVSSATSGLGCTNATPYLDHVTVSGGGVSCALGATPLWLLDANLVGVVSITQSSAHVLRGQFSGGNVSLPANTSVTDGNYGSALTILGTGTVSGTHVSGALTIQGSGTVSGIQVSSALTIQGSGTVTSSTVGNLNISGSGDVQNVVANGSISIASGQVLDSTLNGGSITAGGIAIITGNTLSGGGIAAGEGSTVSRNNIENASGNGISTSGSSTSTYNRVVGSAGKGIVATGGTVENNLVANTTGNGLEAAGGSIRNNTFTGNKGNALYLTGVPTAFDHNNFEFNPGAYDVYLTVTATATTNLNAQNNWWGTTDSNLIKQRIYDYMDGDFTLAKLITAPALNAPSQTAPGYARGITLNPGSPVGIQTVSFTAEFSRPMLPEQNPAITFLGENPNTWTVKAPMPTSRSTFGVAAAPNGKIYAIGGDSGSTVAEYDPLSDTWTTKAPKPTEGYWVGVTTAPNGKIYAIGGYGGARTIEEYDPLSDTWTTKAPMPTGKAAMGVTAAPNGKIYAIGGWGGESIVEEYDPLSDTWTTKAPMPTPRHGLGVTTAPNGKIYAIGGAGGESTVEEYDPLSDTWTVKAPMPTPRAGLGVTTAPNGKIYAIGGGSTVEEYDPLTDTWTVVASMPTPRSNLGVTTASNGKIYAIGGSGGLSTVEEFTLPDWRRQEIMGNPQWVDSSHYRSDFDFSTLIARGWYVPVVKNAFDPDGMQIAPYTGAAFQVDYGSEISDTTPPAAPSVSAWGNGTLTQLSARATASDSGSAIAGYRYAIGTTPGGTDVVNWTNSATAVITRSGLNLLAGQKYYISFMARNTGGLWSPVGVSNAVKDGVAVIFKIYLPTTRR